MNAPPNKIQSEGDGFFTIKSVPIFETHDTRGFDCDEEWMRDCVQNFETDKANGHRPVIIIGHNIKGQEKRAFGFLDNLMLKGKRLFADLVRVPAKLKDEIKENAYPSRSVEVLPNSKRILALALLGGTAPYFSLPQLVYSHNQEQERSFWFRSPIMPNVNTNQSDVNAIAAAAAAEAVKQYSAQQSNAQNAQNAQDEPQVFQLNIQQSAKFMQENPDVQIYEGQDGAFYAIGDEGEYYQIAPQVLNYGIKDFASNVAGKVAHAGGALASKVGPLAAKAAAAAARHPKTALGIASGATVLGAAGGYHRARQEARGEKSQEGRIAHVAKSLIPGRNTGRFIGGKYQIDENTGVVYFNGEPFGEIQQYGDGDPAMGELPNPDAGGTPDLVVEEGAVGHGSRENPALMENPGNPESNFLSPTNRDDSDQYQAVGEALQYVNGENEQQNAELYQLQQEVSQLRHANELLQFSRKGEAYKKYLLGLKQSGTPIGDIEQTTDFMLSQDEEGIKKFKATLESMPKLQLGAAQYSKEETPASDVKQDYASHRMEYQKLGVTEEDLKYASHVRVNTFTNQTGVNGARIS